MSEITEVTCVVCGKPEKFCCHICGGAAYCSEECQTAHWTQHVDECNVEYLEDPSITIAMPFNLVDEDDKKVELRVMEFAKVGTEGKTRTRVLESEHPETKLIGKKQLVARMRRKQDLGVGRNPTEDEANGEEVKMTVIFVDRKTGERFQDDYPLELPKDMIYDGSDDPLVQGLIPMRKRFRQHGMVLWANLKNIGKDPMRINTDGLMTIIVKRANNDEYTIKFRIRNIRPLRWRPFRRASRLASWFDKTFRTGLTGRAMMKAKGILPTNEHFIFNAHDEHISSGMQVTFVLRMGEGNFAEPVDFEIYIPDNMPATKDTLTDTNSQLRVENAVIGETLCYDGEVDDVTALCMNLRDHIAQQEVDLVDFHTDKFEDHDEINKEVEAGIVKAKNLLSTILSYQTQLEADKDAEITTNVQSAITQASELLAVDGKMRQRRWARRVTGKKDGVGWAEDKAEKWLSNPKKNKRKLIDLYGALEKARIGGKSDKKRALELMKQLDDEGYSTSSSWSSRTKKKFKKFFKRKEVE